MSRARTPAVVLRRWPYAESSLVLRALTPGQGVQSLFAKGAQRPKSGHMGVLDTWCLVEVEFGGPPEAELLTLYDARLLERFRGLARSRDTLAAAGLVAELAELAAPPGAPAAPVFLYLVRFLQDLNAGRSVEPRLAAALMEGLGLLGMAPVLPEGELRQPVWFSAAWGGILPPDAAAPAEGRRRLGPAEAALLRAMARRPMAAADAGPKEVAAVRTILEEFLLYHLDRPPRALEFLHRPAPAPDPQR